MVIEVNLTECEIALIEKLYISAVEQKFNDYDFVEDENGKRVDNVYPELIGVNFRRPLDSVIAHDLWHFLHNHLDNHMSDPDWDEIYEVMSRLDSALGISV